MFGFGTPKTKQQHVRKWIIGLGFFSGLWIAIGIDPKTFAWEWGINLLQNIHPTIKWILITLPTIITAWNLIRILTHGGWTGALAVFLAFIGGIILLNNPIVGLIITLAAVLIGFLSFSN